MSKKRGVAKKIHRQNKIYKIQNENGEWLTVIGQNPRINWVVTRYLADTFTYLKLEWLKEFFSDINFDSLNLIEVDTNEIESDKERYLKVRS